MDYYDTDSRFDFFLSIPIADRPEHLKNCLESIWQLCQLYQYGGKKEGFFSKVSVIIAEDSQFEKYIEEDIRLANEYRQKGLKVIHFGQQEQRELLAKIPAEYRSGLKSIIGEHSMKQFYHKGQAIMRNLSYLKLLEIANDKNKSLFYFVDSDQTFQVNVASSNGDKNIYALNYFYTINRLFTENNISLLTGKLVGDPPVSPSVMAVNFLQDVIAFLHQLADQPAEHECQFHQPLMTEGDHAAYHDMANLFGFENIQKVFNYRCELQHQHNHIDCMNTFFKRINCFFFGEHPTRKTHFKYIDSLLKLTPARTIYPGNYITTFEGMKYIIPFGDLRLRMSGPTAGRLIQAEIKEKFVSANVPMMHTRTLQSDFSAEFRPGVEKDDEIIDLSDEFERQFFGDLMLFSVVDLSKQKVNFKQLSKKFVTSIFDKVEIELLDLYKNKHQKINDKCNELLAVINDKSHWWNHCEDVSKSVIYVKQFINNNRHNFGKGSTAYVKIKSPSHRLKKKNEMINALLNYQNDRDTWDKLLDDIESLKCSIF
ncbi:MAG: hypothetical protein HON94_05540 [Methylococcales bacterium]|nr:hypothetical protein [Methylococcales bacterium]MBT7411078.1 hypothetical protein [Methylococcales bacterium]